MLDPCFLEKRSFARFGGPWLPAKRGLCGLGGFRECGLCGVGGFRECCAD